MSSFEAENFLISLSQVKTKKFVISRIKNLAGEDEVLVNRITELVNSDTTNK